MPVAESDYNENDSTDMDIDGTDILELGIPEGPLVGKALKVAHQYSREGVAREKILAVIGEAWTYPDSFERLEIEGNLLVEFVEAVQSRRKRQQFIESLAPLDEPREFKEWGTKHGLVPDNAQEQMRDAMRVPVAESGALMPDAHLGYGLPVGGVWALRDAVSPNAVGVDIGCRMKLSVFPVSPKEYGDDQLERLLVENTHFGTGSGSDEVTDHPVFDRDE